MQSKKILTPKITILLLKYKAISCGLDLIDPPDTMPSRQTCTQVLIISSPMPIKIQRSNLSLLRVTEAITPQEMIFPTLAIHTISMWALVNKYLLPMQKIYENFVIQSSILRNQSLD
jgi:hypothetical protein